MIQDPLWRPTTAREGTGGAARSKPEPGLYIVSTPIGNLRDITLRALDTLAAADLIACEDTRVTRQLLTAYGIGTRTIAYHEHNAAKVRPRLLAELARGAVVALVSDSGTPLISDPGLKLVREALTAHRIVPIPGPSAPLAALVASGLPTNRILFVGFLPPRSAAREQAIDELCPIPATLILFEAARRLPDTLNALARRLGDRPAVIARELTKIYEELRRGSLPSLADHYRTTGPPRGEVVLVVGPPDAAAQEVSEASLDRLLGDALAVKSVRDAADAVASATGLPRRTVYTRALRLVRDRS